MRTRLLFVTGALIGTSVPANGFYFPNWPGARLPPPPPSLVPPDAPGPGNPPSVTPPTTTPPVLVPPDEETPPGQVPEPATLAGAVAGLAAVSVARLRRSVRFRRSPSASEG